MTVHLFLVALALSGLHGADSPTLNQKIMVIFPYKHQGTWVFDDEKTGLVREPFIAGIDATIDRLTEDIPNAEKGFKALFSSSPFPGHTVKLEWRRAETGGNWYYAD